MTQFSSGHPKPRLEDGASLCTWQSAISGTQISPPPLLPSSPLSPPRVSGPLPSPCFVWFDWRSLRFSADRSARSHELVFFVVLKRLVFGRSRMNWSLWYGEDWWSLVHVCVSLPSLCVSIANRVRTSSRKTRCDWSAPAAIPDARRGIGLGQGQREQFLRKVGGDVGIEYETGHNRFQSAFVPCGLSIVSAPRKRHAKACPVRIICTGRFEMHIVRIASFEDTIRNPRVWLHSAGTARGCTVLRVSAAGVNFRCAILMMAY